MATMFACLNHALEDLTVGSVNADIGAESCSQANPAASGKCPKFPVHYNIAKDYFLISNSFTNNFSVSFRFQSTSSVK